MKTENTGSPSRGMAIFWASLLAPASELLPAAGAGRSGWISTLLTVPLVLGAGWLLRSVGKREGLAQGYLKCMGPIAGRVVLGLYLIWCTVLTGLRLRLCAQRLLDTGQRDGALWFFLIGLTAMALWMAWGNRARLARTAKVLLAALLVTALAVLGLSAVRVRPENLFPIWKSDIGRTVWGIAPNAAVFAFALPAAFLQDPGTKEQHLMKWTVLGSGVLAQGQLILLGCLGPALAGELAGPFFTLAQSVGVEGGFQRVESVVSSVWIFSDLILLAVLLLAQRILWGELIPQWDNHTGAGMGALLGLCLAAALPHGVTRELSQTLGLLGGGVLAIAAPGLALVIRHLRGKKREKPA